MHGTSLARVPRLFAHSSLRGAALGQIRFASSRASLCRSRRLLRSEEGNIPKGFLPLGGNSVGVGVSVTPLRGESSGIRSTVIVAIKVCSACVTRLAACGELPQRCRPQMAHSAALFPVVCVLRAAFQTHSDEFYELVPYNIPERRHGSRYFRATAAYAWIAGRIALCHTAPSVAHNRPIGESDILSCVLSTRLGPLVGCSVADEAASGSGGRSSARDVAANPPLTHVRGAAWLFLAMRRTRQPRLSSHISFFGAVAG